MRLLHRSLLCVAVWSAAMSMAHAQSAKASPMDAPPPEHSAVATPSGAMAQAIASLSTENQKAVEVYHYKVVGKSVSLISEVSMIASPSLPNVVKSGNEKTYLKSAEMDSKDPEKVVLTYEKLDLGASYTVTVKSDSMDVSIKDSQLVAIRDLPVPAHPELKVQLPDVKVMSFDVSVPLGGRVRVLSAANGTVSSGLFHRKQPVRDVFLVGETSAFKGMDRVAVAKASTQSMSTVSSVLASNP